MPAANPTSRLHAGMRAIDAFVVLADDGLAAIADQLDALNRRDHPDDVHALRVAVRHLRAVCWAFGPALPKVMRARWRDSLRQLARAAGDVRDWDVFIGETLRPALDRQPGDPVLAALSDIATMRRHLARATMMAQLAQYQHWPLPALHRDLAHLGSGTVHGPRAGARARLDTFARRRIRRARERVKALARAARGADLARVHRYRIGSKRLRYAIEALAPVLPKRFGQRLHDKLVRRQGQLGKTVDNAVARRLMAECMNTPAPGAQAPSPPSPPSLPPPPSPPPPPSARD
ncbi:CHAD domain-containing protein [Cupriavidus sp. WS]|uniref:CHAD domain-containing protein n=1 Tax=Cupriavidus sp. WS TaxID=1312922 RepID=UPI00037EB7C0|nr:CHAD domain-containing protein [Cupriavidus sp. WS]